MQIDGDLLRQQTDDWGGSYRPKKDEEPPPEKYSLEWYVMEAERKKAAREAAGNEREGGNLGAVVALALELSAAAIILPL